MMRGVYLLPNLFTTGNLFFGFYSLIASLHGKYDLAAWCILIAIFFDMLDGRVARLMGASSEFGTYYDSLADLVSFGVAPSVMAYKWMLSPLQRIGWLTAFLFLVCGALRLARFNTQAFVSKGDFQGLPIPAAAGAIATSYLFIKKVGFFINYKLIVLCFCILMISFSCLMVSNLKYKALKESETPRRHPFRMLLVAVLIFFILASEPHIMLFLFAMGYVASGPIISLKKRKVSVTEKEELEV